MQALLSLAAKSSLPGGAPGKSPFPELLLEADKFPRAAAMADGEVFPPRRHSLSAGSAIAFWGGACYKFPTWRKHPPFKRHPGGQAMKISFRLQELLDEHHDLSRGTIKRIAKATSLERHQVAAVLGNRAKYVSMETLAALCQYLIEHHGMDRADLPGKLFRIEPDGFSPLVANPKLVELCIGMGAEKKKPLKNDSPATQNNRLKKKGGVLRRRLVVGA